MKKFILAFALGLFVFNSTGCNTSPAAISATGKALANSMLAIAQLEATENPTASQALTTAANDMVAATANWQTGGSVTVINDVANAAEVVLASIPQTAVVAPLIPVLVAAIDVFIAQLSPAPTTATTALAPNPYRGKVVIHHRLFRSQAGDLKAAWNKVIKLHPNLIAAQLK